MNVTARFLCGLLMVSAMSHAQTLKRLDGSPIIEHVLDHQIDSLVQQAKITGLGISILINNEPVYTHGFGPPGAIKDAPLTPGAIVYGASLSKAVFAYLAMQLVQEHVIDLDRPLYNYLPRPLPQYAFADSNKGYSQLKDDLRYQKITARMCLDHTTGLPNWRWLEPDGKLRIKFDPGTRYSYSGEGLYLLQFVIEQITGKDLETLARERVFIPLQMKNTSYVWRDDFAGRITYGHDQDGKPYKFKHRTEANAAGSLCTTLSDYSSFFSALMQKKGLSKRTFTEMITPQVRIRQVKQFGPLALKDSTLNDAVQLSYGLGFGVLNTPAGRAFFKEGHDNGWQHYSIGYPGKGIAVIIMCNSDNGEGIFKSLLELTIGDTYSPWYWENYIPYDPNTNH